MSKNRPRIKRNVKVVGGWECRDATHWGCGTTPLAAYVDWFINARGDRS